jgi:Asp-tRNA(Asn)/Glu-tRNA(Gln) amidotransferase A subunit family amidase
MKNISDQSVHELAAGIARREVSVETVVRHYIDRIEAREAAVRAWQFFDADLALEQARRLDRQPVAGPLFGIPVGVKDLMDTADMPTCYGSPIYSGHRPLADAGCVAASRTAGAVIMGKTVTTEFATYQPGPTSNPRSAAGAHTPGGSSSGSAAAVAAGMAPLAFGTQTAGSIIRPAAYCGVVGYKPTHATLPLAGIRPLAPSLDTVGVLARTVADAAFFVGALARLPLMPGPEPQARLRIGLCRTVHWDRASPAAREALDLAGRALERAGAVLGDVSLPPSCDGLAAAQITIMGYEAAAAFEHEARTAGERFSSGFAALLGAGRQIDGGSFFAAQALAETGRNALAALFGTVDILIAPSAEGEAPAGLGATGDPIFNRIWTLLGNPCVHVPVGTGAGGMPVGVTVIGPRWADARTLAAASRLERSIAALNGKAIT